jgi:hypothetical protein
MKKLRFAFRSFANTPKKRVGSAISVIRFGRSCSCVIGLRHAVVLSRLQQGFWGPFCKQGENDR